MFSLPPYPLITHPRFLHFLLLVSSSPFPRLISFPLTCLIHPLSSLLLSISCLLHLHRILLLPSSFPLLPLAHLFSIHGLYLFPSFALFIPYPLSSFTFSSYSPFIFSAFILLSYSMVSLSSPPTAPTRLSSATAHHLCSLLSHRISTLFLELLLCILLFHLLTPHPILAYYFYFSRVM